MFLFVVHFFDTLTLTEPRRHLSDVRFQDDTGVEYVWKDNKPGLALQVPIIFADVS